MWFGEPHPFPERGSPTILSMSGKQRYEGWSCTLLNVPILRHFTPPRSFVSCFWIPIFKYHNPKYTCVCNSLWLDSSGAEEVLDPRSTPQIDCHPLSFVRECLQLPYAEAVSVIRKRASSHCDHNLRRSITQTSIQSIFHPEHWLPDESLPSAALTVSWSTALNVN
jgi:hypothetical protein